MNRKEYIECCFTKYNSEVKKLKDEYKNDLAISNMLDVML